MLAQRCQNIAKLTRVENCLVDFFVRSLPEVSFCIVDDLYLFIIIFIRESQDRPVLPAIFYVIYIYICIINLWKLKLSSEAQDCRTFECLIF